MDVLQVDHLFYLSCFFDPKLLWPELTATIWPAWVLCFSYDSFQCPSILFFFSFSVRALAPRLYPMRQARAWSAAASACVCVSLNISYCNPALVSKHSNQRFSSHSLTSLSTKAAADRLILNSVDSRCMKAAARPLKTSCTCTFRDLSLEAHSRAEKEYKHGMLVVRSVHVAISKMDKWTCQFNPC